MNVQPSATFQRLTKQELETYFADKTRNVLPTVLGLVAVGIISFLMRGWFCSLLGFVLLGAAVYVGRALFKPPVVEADMDRRVDETILADLNSVFKRSETALLLEKLEEEQPASEDGGSIDVATNLSEDRVLRDPLILRGMISNASSVRLQSKEGADHRFRYSCNRITVYYFTRHFLAIYQCDYDSINQEITDENVYECYYRYISSFGINEENLTYRDIMTLESDVQEVTSRFNIWRWLNGANRRLMKAVDYFKSENFTSRYYGVEFVISLVSGKDVRATVGILKDKNGAWEGSAAKDTAATFKILRRQLRGIIKRGTESAPVVTRQAEL